MEGEERSAVKAAAQTPLLAETASEDSSFSGQLYMVF